MHVKKSIAFPSNQKVLLKIQNHQNWPHNFLYKKFDKRDDASFCVFGSKMYFLISRTWQLLVFSSGDRRQIDAVFNINKIHNLFT